MSQIEQSDGDCCAGRKDQTPVRIYNEPGQDAIIYRVGTYAQFKSSMLAHLADKNLPGLSQRSTKLAVRETTDFSIALLDAWAMVLDILTFYQERIANESYKNTACDPGSLIDLARLVNYRLQPGIAAQTYLAFTLDTAPGSPTHTKISIGTKVQSLPNPGQTPQMFEIAENIEADTAWNQLQPALTLATKQVIPLNVNEIIIQSINTNLRPGDGLLIISPDKTDPTGFAKVFRRVTNIQSNVPGQQTTVQTEIWTNFAQRKSSVTANLAPNSMAPSSNGHGLARLWQAMLKLFTIPLFANLSTLAVGPGRPQSSSSVAVLPSPSGGGSLISPKATTAATPPLDTTLPIEPGVYALRTHASLFGYNAPDWNAMPSGIRMQYNNDKGAEKVTDWPLRDQQPGQLDLDRVSTQIIPGSWVVINYPGNDPVISRVVAVEEVAVANYALSAKVSRLFMDPDVEQPKTFSDLRQATVYAQSEMFPLAEALDPTPIKGQSISILPLSVVPPDGQKLIVKGQTDDTNEPQVETVTLRDALVTDNGATLNFQGALAYSYKRETVQIYGNVALATQGETIKDEVLGSGDATQSYQSFTLRQFPLAYIQSSAPGDDGKKSTLSISVDGLPWHEVDTFYRHGPRERIFVTNIAEDKTVTVTFGNGQTGARLPTGTDNVHATYSKGIDVSGVILPRQLSILQTRPLGVKSVTNYQIPMGAVDPEESDDARRKASNAISNLGRAVSKDDYTKIALSYAGVAKAQTTIIWQDQMPCAYVTIVVPELPEGGQIELASGRYEKIATAISRASDPTVSFVLQGYTPVRFNLAAKIKVGSDGDPSQVLSSVESKVRLTFSFDARSIGQAVTAQEIIAVIKTISGVATVSIESLYKASNPVTKEKTLMAALPSIQPDGTVSLAELLMVGRVNLEAMP